MRRQTYIFLLVSHFCKVLLQYSRMEVTVFLLRCVTVQTKYLRSCLCLNKYSGIMGKVEMFPQKRPAEIHQRLPGNRAFRTASCSVGEDDSKLPSVSSLEWDPDFNCTVQVGFLPEGIL